MREFIRHPFDITIRYTVEDAAADSNKHLKNISEGGLCFKSKVPLAEGSRIHIEIPVEDPPFQIDGIVAWCREQDGYEVGVRFENDSKTFGLRMVEQVCHIKHYMQEVKEKEGRELSPNEAAAEWILKYGRIFPY